jgi:hypothetical protein
MNLSFNFLGEPLCLIQRYWVKHFMKHYKLYYEFYKFFTSFSCFFSVKKAFTLQLISYWKKIFWLLCGAVHPINTHCSKDDMLLFYDQTQFQKGSHNSILHIHWKLYSKTCYFIFLKLGVLWSIEVKMKRM